jgi:hypothetical protein
MINLDTRLNLQPTKTKQMKSLFKTLLILLIANLGFAQSSKTIHNKDGLTVSYVLSKIGSDVNPATGTNFYKYNLHLTVQNSSSKFWAYNAINSINSKNIKSGILNTNDETFCWNGGSSKIDHFCIEDNCTDFPRYNNVAAPHQVICPSSTQECEKTFLYPTELVGDPEIEWTSWGFVEMLVETNTNNKNHNPKTTISKKNIIPTAPLNQTFAYKGAVNLLEMRTLLSAFIESNFVMPKSTRYYGEGIIVNFEVNENGKIINPIVESEYPEIKEAVIKVLKLSEKDWTTRIVNGKKKFKYYGAQILHSC